MADRSANSVPQESWNGTDSSSERTGDHARSRASGTARPVALKYSNDGDPRKTEWASTLLLVQEASEAIKASEERVEGLERELEIAAFQARDEQRMFTAKLNAAQDEIVAANARAKALEARAQEAEAWLHRLNEAIVTGFGRQDKAEQTSEKFAEQRE